MKIIKHLHLITRGNLFNKTVMRSIYNKEDDKEQLENFFKKLDDFNKHMDKGNIDNFIDKEQPNIKRTDSKKPVTITYINKRTRIKSEAEVDVTKSIKEQDIEGGIVKEKKEAERKSKVVGTDVLYPIENFVNLTSKQGNKTIKLNSYKYSTPNPKGVLYLIHGLFEHANSNAHLAKKISEGGYDVLSLDLRGHGKSEGIKGYMENVDAVLEDIDRYIGLTEEEYSGKGKYIFGFSMGGMFANMMTIKKKNYFNGNIMIAPPFLFESSALVKWESVIRFLAKVCPSWKLIPNLGKAQRPEIEQMLNNDPLIYKGRYCAGTIMTVLNTVGMSNSNISKVNTPYYLLHGKSDDVALPKGSTNFHNSTQIRDKTFILIDGMDHFIVRDPMIYSFISDIVFWMDMHLN